MPYTAKGTAELLLPYASSIEHATGSWDVVFLIAAGANIAVTILAIAVLKKCKSLSLEQAATAIFGYTFVNDITALDLIAKHASFAEWTRAKSFDGLSAFAPVVATGIDWKTLTVKTLLNSRERQNYACSDMIFSPEHIVSALSAELRWTCCP